jgi:hypothetical protein
LLAFPDSHALPQVAVFWIRLCYSHSFLLFQRFLGYFGCDNLSTISFLSPLGFAFSVTLENAVLYPQVSLLRSEPSLTSIFLSPQVDCGHTLRYQILVFININTELFDGPSPYFNYLQSSSITSCHRSELLPVDKTLPMTLAYS